MLLALLACVGLLAFAAISLYKRRALLMKKSEAGDGAVSFNGNVISFSNPVLDAKQVSPPYSNTNANRFRIPTPWSTV